MFDFTNDLLNKSVNRDNETQSLEQYQSPQKIAEQKQLQIQEKEAKEKYDVEFFKNNFSFKEHDLVRKVLEEYIR